MYQSITVVGNVGGEVTMRYTPSGKAVTNFSVAVNEKFGDKETVTWFKVSCWDKLAEITNQYLTKGKQVLITGRVSASAYLNKQQEPAVSLEITVRDLKFLGSKNDGATAGSGGQDAPTDEDGLPF